MNRSVFFLPAALLIFSLLLLAPPAAAQMNEVGGDGEFTAKDDLFARPIRDSTVVRAGPSASARIIDYISTNTVLRSVGDQNGFEKVEPRAGGAFPWNSGWVLQDNLEIGIDTPRRPGIAVFGALAGGSSGSSVLSANDIRVAQDHFGKPGTLPMYGLGFTFNYGRFIPEGQAGFKLRLDGEVAFLQGQSGFSGVADSTNGLMIRGGVGGNLVYRVSPYFDVSLGAVAGGGPAFSEVFADDRTLSSTAWYGTGEAFAGLGYGRNATGGLSLRGRLEGGYRLATQLSDWSYEFEDGDALPTSFESEGQAFDPSGPFLRLVIGI